MSRAQATISRTRGLVLAWLVLVAASPAPVAEADAGPGSDDPRAAARCGADAPPEFGGFAAGAGVAVGVLNLPGVGAAPTLWTRLAPARTWALELSLDAWLDNDAELSVYERDLGVHPLYVVPYPEAGGRIRFHALEGGVAVCPYRAPLDPGELSFCAGVRGGVIEARGVGFAEARDETRGLLAVEGHARWRYHLAGPVGITYSAGLLVPVLRDQFTYVDAFGRERDKFRQAPLVGRLDLALTWDF